jgi:hypothetical protein
LNFLEPLVDRVIGALLRYIYNNILFQSVSEQLKGLISQDELRIAAHIPRNTRNLQVLTWLFQSCQSQKLRLDVDIRKNRKNDSAIFRQEIYSAVVNTRLGKGRNQVLNVLPRALQSYLVAMNFEAVQ